MRNGLIGSTLLMQGMFALSPLLAQTGSGPPAAKTIPDLSGIWEEPLYQPFGGTPRQDICGEGSCAALLGAPQVRDVTVIEPQMLPWAEQKYNALREGIKDPTAGPPQAANPWFSACLPDNPARMMLRPVIGFELRQFPDVVLILFGGPAGEADHAVRRIYVDGRGHPPDLKPTWMGHSIGRYDGDALVVDTIGIKEGRWVDNQGHPHSDALHLVERIRRVDQKHLEVEVTFDDPKTYKNTWSKKIVRGLAPAGPGFWEDVLCEELLRMGTHYSAEAKKYRGSPMKAAAC